MRLDSITLDNYLSHQRTRLEFDGARLTAILGENGAGKTAALEALPFSLYGAGRNRLAELVRIGESDMSTSVEFGHAGARYRVMRGRTRRSGGSGFAEVQIADGAGWRPLTGDSKADTGRVIRDLLHLDQAAFLSAVFLRQGEVDRFLRASPGVGNDQEPGRRRILGSLLDLDSYERAAERARRLGRQAADQVALEEAAIARLDTELAAREAEEATAAHWRTVCVDAETKLARAESAREGAEKRLRVLAQGLAAAQVAEAEVTRLEEVIADHKSRWQRADGQRTAAVAAIARAEATLGVATAVGDAARRLETVRATVSAADQAEGQHRAAADALRGAEDRLRELEQARATALRDHEAGRHRLEDQVRSLEEQQAGLEPVACPRCGERFAADPSDLAGRVEAARQQLAAYPGPPTQGLAVERQRAQVTRRQIDVEKAGWDPAAAVRDRQLLVGLERLAARAGEIAAARQSVEGAHQRAAAAVDELAAIDEAGKTARAALLGARERVSGAVDLRRRETAEQRVLEAARSAVSQLEPVHKAARVSVARSEAVLERLDSLAGDRAAAAARTHDLRVDMTRMRKLADAFAVRIPSRIIETVLPELAVHANELLARLAPGMTLDIRAQRAKAKGDGTIEAIDLLVRLPVGELPVANLSGGQGTVVALAIAVALSRLSARRASAAIRTLVADELPFLDEERTRALGQAFVDLSNSGEWERIVCITHDETLAGYCDEIIRFALTPDGVSHLQEAA